MRWHNVAIKMILPPTNFLSQYNTSDGYISISKFCHRLNHNLTLLPTDSLRAIYERLSILHPAFILGLFFLIDFLMMLHYKVPRIRIRYSSGGIIFRLVPLYFNRELRAREAYPFEVFAVFS